MQEIEAAIDELEREKQALIRDARETVSECLWSMAMATDMKISALRRATAILDQRKSSPA